MRAVAGSRIYIGDRLSPKRDVEILDFKSINWIEVQGWVTAGQLGDSRELIAQSVIGKKRASQAKGTKTGQAMENVFIPMSNDPGQIRLREAAADCGVYAFRIDWSDKCIGDESVYSSYFYGLVLDGPLRGGEANTALLKQWSIAPVSNILMSTYSNEAVNLFARMDVQPTRGRKELINLTIATLKDAGLWTKLDCLYFLAAHDAQAARLNWVADQHNLTPVNSPAFTADLGYTGDATTSYLETGRAPNGGGNFALNSGSVGVYVNGGDDSGGPGAPIGVSGGVGAVHVNPRSLGDRPQGRLNQGAITTFNDLPTFVRRGFCAISRNGSADLIGFRGNTASGPVSVAPTGATGNTFWLCGLNSSGTLMSGSDDRIAFAFIGGGLTNAQMDDLRVAVSAYLTAIGAD